MLSIILLAVACALFIAHSVITSNPDRLKSIGLALLAAAFMAARYVA